MKAPFPWFGGKSRVAADVWARLGNPASYVEPFFGSGAVLLDRPGPPGVETVNDADGLLANFWRALQAAPDEVAHHADWPVSECDLHARHLWLVGQRESLTDRLMGDHAFYDTRAAGWWVWGVSCWIGSGWCSGKGPWVSVDGRLVNGRDLGTAGRGVNRQMPHVGTAGRGVNRQMPHVGTAGQGVNRKMPHVGTAGQRVASLLAPVAQRMRNVRVVCGDWSRVMGDAVLFPLGRASGGGVLDATSCGVFLDPPYRSDNSIDYAHGLSVCHDEVEAWCRDNGHRKQLRIALCGYDGEYDLPGWDVFAWKARGGYGNQGDGDGRANAARERVWFSPHCLRALQTQGALL